MTNIEHNFLKTNKKIKVFHSSVRKTEFSSRLIQTHLTFWLFSKKGILKVSKLCEDPRSGLEKQQLCFWDYKQKSKLLRALGVSERQMRRKLAELKKLGLVYERFGNLHIRSPFDGEGKYTIVPIRVDDTSILKRGFPILEWIMQCIKADALCEHHAQCQISFGQNSRTLRRKNALLKTYSQADKKVRPLRRILLIKETTDFKKNQNFLKFKEFEERENAKKEKFLVVPRERTKKAYRCIRCMGQRFDHTQEIHLEAYKQAKKLGCGFSLRWLEYAPIGAITRKKRLLPGFVQGKFFKQAEKRKKVSGTWVSPTLFIRKPRRKSLVSLSGALQQILPNRLE